MSVRGSCRAEPSVRAIAAGASDPNIMARSSASTALADGKRTAVARWARHWDGPILVLGFQYAGSAMKDAEYRKSVTSQLVLLFGR